MRSSGVSSSSDCRTDAMLNALQRPGGVERRGRRAQADKCSHFCLPTSVTDSSCSLAILALVLAEMYSFFSFFSSFLVWALRAARVGALVSKNPHASRTCALRCVHVHRIGRSAHALLCAVGSPH